ncbi:MAG: caspase family protein, partial [Bacteroidota bacterium]
MCTNVQSVIMGTVLKSFLSSTVRWLLACVAMTAMVIMPLSAQTEDKGFIIAGSKDRAQSLASIQGTRWALLVGIANYPPVEGFEIQDLKAPVKDANAFAAFLKDPEKGGFDADHVFTLTDEEATRRNILITFNEIAKRAAPEDMVIFYFSGHGTRLSDSETSYLIPYDHDLRDLGTTGIDFDDLAEKIRKMEASKVVVILDACNSGGVKQEGAKAAASAGIVKRYLDAFQESEGRALLLSSDESEVSWETEQYGVFTHFLLEGLDGKADENDDGIVTFMEAALYVERTVQEYTRANFPRVQKPVRRHLGDKERGDIPLAINRDKVVRQRYKALLDGRKAAILLQASPAGLDQARKEFSLKVAESAYQKALSGEELTRQERSLLLEIDALQAGTITAVEYIDRARIIIPILTQLRITITPGDATVTLAPVDAQDRVIPPYSPNVYQIQPGRYRLSAQRSGYVPYSRELTLDLANETATVTLERLMGTLQLQIDPIDAVVMVTSLSVAAPDTEASKPIRVQPIGGRKLPIGTYSLTAE